MPTPPLSPEQMQEAIELVEKYGSVHKAAREIGVAPSTLKNRYNRAKQAGVECEDGFRIRGTSTLYDEKGSQLLQWVKTTEDKERYKEKILALAEELKSDLPKAKPQKPQSKEVTSHLMSVYPFGDPHCGMYAWAAEVGNDFDLDIFRNDLCAAVDYLVGQSPPSERGVIISLGDFFHADNLEGKTSKSGNILDMDTRLPKVIRVGFAAMRQAIESALRKHKTVEVICAVGNHDEVLSAVMSLYLASYYENEPRVIVHDNPTRRHYIRHGKVLIGVTHGDKTKDRDLPGIMATERAEDWGQTKYRYYYRGHQHHDSLQEFNGCIVEQFRTLAPGDAYNHGLGYLSGRDMKLIVHHDQFGERARSVCSVDLLRSLS